MRQSCYTRLLLTATLALGLTGCSSAPSLPAVSPNPTVSVTSGAGRELLTATRLDQDQAAQLTAEVKQAAADPTKAAALISELGGAGLLRAVVLGSTVKDAGLADGVREVFQAGQSKLDAETAQRVASELLDGLRVKDATQKANNVLALSFLLRDSTLNPELLIALAPGVIEADQQVLSEKKFWSSQSKTWADVTGSASPSMKNLFEGQNWAAVSDLLLLYLNGLSRDGVTALAVFTDTPLGTTEPKQRNYLSKTALARQRYLIEQRSWAHDQFTALTAALDAATTSKETIDSPLASGLVSSIVEMLANRSQGQTTDEQPLTFTDPLDRVTADSFSPEATLQLANTVGHYFPSVVFAITRTDGGGDTTTTLAGKTGFIDRGVLELREVPRFRRNDTKIVIRAICGTEEGFNRLNYLMNQHFTTLVSDEIIQRTIQRKKANNEQYPPSYQELLDASLRYDAKTRGFLYQSLAAIAISRGATPTQVRDYFTATTNGQTPAIPAYDQPTKTPVLDPEKRTFNNRPDIEQSLLTDTTTHLATTRLTQLATINPHIDPENTNKYAETLLTSFNTYY